MSILNRGWIYDSITRNQDSGSVSYRWTHGANDTYMGAGIFYYAIPYFLRAQTCVCLGSGGGYVPRLMVDCVWELNETQMYGEGKSGEVYVIDATNGFNGEVDWSDEDSFLREKFNPKFINSTTEDAFYNFFVKRDIKIDYLHIDAGHTYEDCKQDFDLYSTLMNENGIISIHDSDERYWEDFETYEGEPHDMCIGPSEVVKEVGEKWEVFNLFDYKEKSEKLSSSGLTLLRRKSEEI
ncbi:class I SAM-dependent methyltransferase [Candidatus Woesearchaeota archaeon]|jgi:hypothetical protein|nr:class I SAM-dependent methyltransferase [Candidatus Woesearchaeota archaeon]MBT7556374.1 class I SAM-dependent methyltransferase [Candidatus Woesearchaeota archaeon]